MYHPTEMWFSKPPCVVISRHPRSDQKYIINFVNLLHRTEPGVNDKVNVRVRSAAFVNLPDRCRLGLVLFRSRVSSLSLFVLFFFKFFYFAYNCQCVGTKSDY